MKQSELRILDANANRCREAIRVVEEYARFHLNHSGQAKRCKFFRHRLKTALDRLNFVTEGQLLWQRNTQGDAGTLLNHPSEIKRDALDAVLEANCKRIQESLRVLEEYSKLLDAEVAAGFEKLRYESYSLEQDVLRISCCVDALANPVMCILDAALPLERREVVVHALEKHGLGFLQLRGKNMSTRDFISVAVEVKRLFGESGIRLVINDRVDIAQAVEADGVHLGQQDMSIEDARAIVGGKTILGATASSVEEAQHAEAAGADYLGVGAAFPTQSKSDAVHRGLAHIRAIQDAVHVPVYAVGGIQTSNANEVAAAGLQRVAIGAGICQTKDPASALTRFYNIFSMNSKDA